jgi:hypothetical protein
MVGPCQLVKVRARWGLDGEGTNVGTKMEKEGGERKWLEMSSTSRIRESPPRGKVVTRPLDH